ncbi:ptr-17 [Pristionchus pacificus]|uniref:Ptr-17 n=1 Tax=Pristionchus pacificus TaxID=54126 RepID=A0A2A6D1R9_PRIPA|nr:ptr-17 [Pristionchus pacificus]|eukprot:PDM84233.1 ptr-17 [Pristionchus pacificus]
MRPKYSLAVLERPWANVLTRYCALVARHPRIFIIVPVILTAILSTGVLFKFKVVRGVHYLYSPLDARWKVEEGVFNTHWASSDNLFYPGKDVLRRKGIYIILTAKDGGSVLRRDHASEFLAVLDWIESVNVTGPDGETYSYKNICFKFHNKCFDNTHVRIAADQFIRTKSHQRVNITWPIYKNEMSEEKIDLSQGLGNVTTRRDGSIIEATSWMVLYQLKQDSDELARLSSNFEKTIDFLSRSGQVPGSLLNTFTFHSDTFDEELADSNIRLIPRFSVTFGILIFFSVVCTFNLHWVWEEKKRQLVVDWVLSKPLMGIVGVMTTMMAIVSAMGLLLLFDVTFVDMCTVMPFLSLTIGIDDTFLILAAWHDSLRHLPVQERIIRSMRHAAVSISITSLTDTVAFLIGAITPLPAVRFFCFYSAAAIVFIFLYSISIFVAILALQGTREENCQNSVTGVKAITDSSAVNITTFERHFNTGSRVDQPNVKPDLIDCIPSDTRLWYQRFFEDVYSPFIWKPEIRLMSLLLFGLYILGSVYGIQRLVVGFDLVNIIQEDSPAHKFFEVKSASYAETMARAEIAVLNPPNLANETVRTSFMNVLTEFEQTACSEGPTSTEFWLYGFREYLNQLGFSEMMEAVLNDDESFTSALDTFLLSSDRFSFDVRRHPNGTLSAFRFSTALNTVQTDYRIVDCCRQFRDIAGRHPEYNLTTYTPFWNLADQFEIMWPQTMQDIYISIGVMIPISLLFIEQPLCAITIGLNIASVAFGVLGFMALWSVNLDATSMITIAMSVGFSVDFAAHVTYAYIMEARSDKENMTACERLGVTLGIVGWPVTQASTSVLLGISTLATVEAYVVQTCFKTVTLVVLFGSIHALLFLPLFLSSCHLLFERIFKQGRFRVADGTKTMTRL